MLSRAMRFAFSSLLLATTVEATSYRVPRDADMIAAAKAIVSGTIIDQSVRRSPTGLIETTTRLLVEERIKNALDESVISFVLPGGEDGGERLIAPGVPSFSPGERVLVFLDRNGRGEWTPFGWALGVFRFRGTLLIRDAGDAGRGRDAKSFMSYVTDTVQGNNPPEPSVAEFAAPARENVTTFTSGGYAAQSDAPPFLPVRRESGAPVAWMLAGQQRDLDLAAAVDAGVAAWNHDTRSATSASGNENKIDSEWRVIPDDPRDEVQGHCCAILAQAFMHQIVGRDHSFNGQTFRTIIESDLIINDGLSSSTSSQQELNDVVIHEMGHSLGLRHADRNGANDPCTPPLDCCIYDNDNGHCVAIMNHSTLPGVHGVQSWDAGAAACLYNSSACTFDRPCVPPEIFTQPTNHTVFKGDAVALLVEVRGTPPFTHQWFLGSSGDTSTPVTTDWDLQLRPTASASYWLRVSGTCGEPVDSHTAVLMVETCPPVVITRATAMNVNGSPDHVSLIAETTASNPRIRWFQGTAPGGSGTFVGTGKSVEVTIAGRTSFWVRIDNTCGNTGVSDLVFADLCGLPSILTQPADRAIPNGESTTLSIVLAGAANVTWYRGGANDKSQPIGTGTQVEVGPLSENATYWAAIMNSCGEIASRTVNVSIAPSRRRSVRH